ncbi:hypothetical protein PPYR_00846 [Photinus pyralis]|uniref:Uncharacterized protein n=5 Tax=Photinus pyralis TaxID=7054 RepID=A0A5N4B2T4_PHOPY|nr:probable multidrug resistance-associated protein lethal(2)03659 isoform X1 [Photinus pyralis]KAB0803876.1 hypothetical protein PPYR_00846 [Photinus pyralis]
MESTVQSIKKKNPREEANCISALFFFYMIPTFIQNYRKGVNRDDVYEPLKAHASATLGDKLEALWNDATRKYEKFGLHVALFKLFGFELILIAVVKLISEVITLIVMPMCVDNLVSYYEHRSEANVEDTYIYGSVLIGILFLDGIVDHHAMLAIMHVCMKMRVSCCSLIYRKSLRLSRTSLAQTTVGQVINLLSTDVSKFDQTFVLYHYAFLGPLETMIGTYLLYRTLGVAAFAGIAFLLLFIPLQLYLCKKIAVLRLRTAFRTDERVRLMNEILNGIQVIKMYTWEKPFAKLIDLARRHEIASIRSHFFLESIMFSLEMFITRTCLFISLVVFIALGATMTADIAYAATSIYSLLRPVMTMLFSISIASYAEVHISIKRVHSFLSYEEQPVDSPESTSPLIRLIPNICIKDVCAKWINTSSDNILTNINLDLHGNNLTAIIGSVGSGKSTLLHLLLGELYTASGDVRIRGTVSYAPQEAWLFSASVKQNILFCHDYNEERYKKVLKVCALERDLALFPFGDRTIIGEKGKSLSGGQKARINLARCIYKDADIYLLDDPLSAVDSKVGKHIFENCIKDFLKDKMRILVTHQLQFLNWVDNIVVLEDGKIVAEATFEELQTSGLNFAKILDQQDIGEDPVQGEKKQRSRQNSESSQNYEQFKDDDEDTLDQEEHLTTGHIKSEVYASYFKAGGNYLVIIFVAFTFIANQVVTNGGDYFVSYWVNLEQKALETNGTVDKDDIIYIYSGLTGGTMILAIGHNLLFFVYAMRASIFIHNEIFQKVSHASMSFYNSNPVGRILNRFSKDIGIIDDYIPFILNDMTEILLMLLGAVVLSATVNPWFLLPSFGLVLLFYFLRIVFLATSRSVKRLEGINRSPILTHLTATIYGLSTIRAFSAQKLLIQEYDTLQDKHSSSWYLFISASRAFGFWLEMICNIFVSGIIISLILIPKGYYGGDIGLVLTQYLGLMGALQYGMRQWSELENNMTSVERILEFRGAQLEPIRDSKAVPKLWPEFGKIVFEHVSMSYAPDLPILSNLNFTIQPGEKVGIVGRTGAGKTSTVAALFQLYNTEGSIIIDEVDITRINLELLRSKISIIPQDPVLFKGTMRKNLDPFEEYSDDVIWNALEQVELKSTVDDATAGLNMSVWENGSNFSIGQRQLICLARAIIRNNKILVMDEATANVDPYTDGLIQKTIRDNFAHCTVITIAHRLHTIMDSDRVLVMDAGCVIEFDHPYNLLHHKNSIFASMVETTGKNISGKLHCIAEESFLKLKNA